jgi:methionyl-tRNA formyltransferase
MSERKLKIVFMGTPGFAAACLEELVLSAHEVVGVVTAPDKPAGRGQKVSFSEVKQCALRHQLPVLQPEKLRDPLFLDALKSLSADVFVVVAFRMLPAVVFEMPPMGSINLHASLLPQYRGAAPINHAIINGEKITGVTTFLIEQIIDTGKWLMREEVGIGEEETAGELHDKLMHCGAKLMLRTLDGLAAGSLQARPQEIAEILHEAPKIFREFCEIKWDKSGKEVVNHIRGLSPYPGAFTLIKEDVFKIYRAYFEEEQHKSAPGTLKTDRRSKLCFAVNDGWVCVTELQAAGKRRMKTEEFLRGNGLG